MSGLANFSFFHESAQWRTYLAPDPTIEWSDERIASIREALSSPDFPGL
ncbi:MAG: hypothetical protein ACRDQA_23030 [Nocardioidaceae bacterium]